MIIKFHPQKIHIIFRRQPGLVTDSLALGMLHDAPLAARWRFMPRPLTSEAPKLGKAKLPLDDGGIRMDQVGDAENP